MGRIRTLPTHVVNQIAAGEVVDRPASVVKELVENALDAGARRVEVRLAEGGKARIEVRDDGCGMDAADLAAAFLPHATSKLGSVEDLDHIASLGFRGEALASIGSVARATITSRPQGADAGGAVEDREGDLGDVRPAAAAPGTVIVVEGLFAGVPARRKFLRTAATELGHVVDTIERFALSFPEAVFLVEHEGRPVVTTAAGEGRRARIGRFHGDDLARSLLEARSADDAPVHVEALLSPPGVTRGDARLQQVYVNGRYVRDRTVGHALREAYRDLVPPGDRQPVVFLFLTCDPARVDVNVHPTKAEVRWRDPSIVHETVRRTLRAALEGARPGVDIGASVSGVRPGTVEAAEFAFTQGVGRDAGSGPFGGGAWTAGPARGPDGAPTFPPPASGADPRREAAHGHAHGPGDGCPSGGGGGRERLRPVGQVLTTYLVLESEDGLVIVDQHALHERILFDRISDRLRTGALEVQHLLVPAVVTLSRAEAARIHDERELIATLGWVVEAFGDDAVAVRAVPAVLRKPDPEGMLHELLGLLESGRREGFDRAALLSAVVDRMACRGAVMAGDPLHPDEVLALLAQAEALNHAHSCPHGRPTRLAMTRRDLERYFHR